MRNTINIFYDVVSNNTYDYAGYQPFLSPMEQISQIEEKLFTSSFNICPEGRVTSHSLTTTLLPGSIEVFLEGLRCTRYVLLYIEKSITVTSTAPLLYQKSRVL